MSTEVKRLRRLRRTTLKLRSFAHALGDGKRSSVFDRAGVLSWRIARIATGQLRAHPYQNYQRDQGVLERGADLIDARLHALLASLRSRGLTAFLDEMSAAARELDDT